MAIWYVSFCILCVIIFCINRDTHEACRRQWGSNHPSSYAATEPSPVIVPEPIQNVDAEVAVLPTADNIVEPTVDQEMQVDDIVEPTDYREMLVDDENAAVSDDEFVQDVDSDPELSTLSGMLVADSPRRPKPNLV